MTPHNQKVIDIGPGSMVFRAKLADGTPVHFQFDETTGEMIKTVSPPPKVLNWFPKHSKFCLRTMKMILTVESPNRMFDYIILNDDLELVSAPCCSCANCCQLKRFEETFRTGRTPIGYQTEMIDSNQDVLIPIRAVWNEDQTQGQIDIFINKSGSIGKYQRKENEKFWSLTETIENCKLRESPMVKPLNDKDLQFHCHERCLHYDQQVFYCSTADSSTLRQFIFNPHHLQFDEIKCRDCLIIPRAPKTSPFLCEDSRLVTVLNVDRLKTTVGVFQSEEGMLLWGIFNPEKEMFEQQTQQVADCTDMSDTSNMVSRNCFYMQQATNHLVDFHFTCPIARKEYSCVFTEATSTGTIFWAMDETGVLRPFGLHRQKLSPSLGVIHPLEEAMVKLRRQVGMGVVSPKLVMKTAEQKTDIGKDRSLGRLQKDDDFRQEMRQLLNMFDKSESFFDSMRRFVDSPSSIPDLDFVEQVMVNRAVNLSSWKHHENHLLKQRKIESELFAQQTKELDDALSKIVAHGSYRAPIKPLFRARGVGCSTSDQSTRIWAEPKRNYWHAPESVAKKEERARSSRVELFDNSIIETMRRTKEEMQLLIEELDGDKTKLRCPFRKKARNETMTDGAPKWSNFANTMASVAPVTSDDEMSDLSDDDSDLSSTCLREMEMLMKEE